MKRSWLLAPAAWIVAAGGLAAAAWGQPPSPLDDPALFSLPGAYEQPPSAASAGMALADQWLGEEPFSNPAAPVNRAVTLSPALLRVSRQDLRARNRNYSETSAFFDGAGASLAVPATPFWLYVAQPVLRFEKFSFDRGTPQHPAAVPATIQGQADMRETRACLAVGAKVTRLRLGLAVEWSRRDDRYEIDEQSADPQSQGLHHVDFSGEGVGGSVGFRFDSPGWEAMPWTIGGALRYVPETKLEGTQQLDVLAGSSESPVSVTRAAGWEGGLSARLPVSPVFRVLAAIGGRTEQKWKGFGLVGGTAVAARIGAELHDPSGPWTLRFGVGQEQQKGVPEPRAGSVALGLGYDMEGVLLDLGVIRRGIQRTDRPTSYDDRVVASVRVDL